MSWCTLTAYFSWCSKHLVLCNYKSCFFKQSFCQFVHKYETSLTAYNIEPIRLSVSGHFIHVDALSVIKINSSNQEHDVQWLGLTLQSLYPHANLLPQHKNKNKMKKRKGKQPIRLKTFGLVYYSHWYHHSFALNQTNLSTITQQSWHHGTLTQPVNRYKNKIIITTHFSRILIWFWHLTLSRKPNLNYTIRWQTQPD